MTRMLHCVDCGEFIEEGRSLLGYKHCLECGEFYAAFERESWCVANIHKSNYILVTDPITLKGLNKYAKT